MSAVPAAPYLAEFHRDADASRRPVFSPLSREGTRDEAEPIAAKIERARAAGFASGEAAARAALDAQLVDLKAAHGRELAAERQAWVHGEAETLEKRLASGLGALERSIAQAAARALAPFLQAEVRRQAIADLGAELEQLLAGGEAIGVSVTGPEDLLQALRERLACSPLARAGSITYAANAEPDVRIVVGDSLLQTRLAAWVRRIEEALR
jgi:hypothetical protein